MQLELITNKNYAPALAYKVARVVYAETLAKSLRVVEALTSMIKNAAIKNHAEIEDIISDTELFESTNKKSDRHDFLYPDTTKRDFQMCLRTAIRMLHGNLPDACYHATRFHRDDFLPCWATSLGYIAEIDGLLFYL